MVSNRYSRFKQNPPTESSESHTRYGEFYDPSSLHLEYTNKQDPLNLNQNKQRI